MNKTASLLLLAIIPAALAAQPTPRPSRAPSPMPPQGVPMPAEPAMPTEPTPMVAPMAYALSGTFPQGFDFPTPSMSARFPQDPADSTYREARSMLNRGEWRRAARLFAEVGNRNPASAYSADALYWQAFALYRIGNPAELREARQALEARKTKFPRADNADEAESLMTRVNGALAARGDAAAATAVRSAAGGSSASCDSEELSVRASALSTLMRNDPDAAMPILVKVLDRKDDCSASMRRSAVMLIGTKGDAAAKAKLNDVARTDPSTPVRADAIGYIAQSNTDEAVATFDAILRNETDLGVQRSVVRALGGMENAKAKAAIKALVERSTAPERLRLDAIATFDRRAGSFSYTYSCSPGGDCRDFGITTSVNVDGRAFITPAPAAPVAIAAPAVAPVAPSISGRAAPARVDEARARAEANAEARAEARAQADEVRAAAAVTRASTPRAYTVSGDEVRWSNDDDDRRISPEDAAWLRGVYPRFETNRLKTAAIAVLARAKDEPTRTWLTNAMSREDEPAEVRAAILSRLGRELPIANLARLYDNASGRSQRQEIVNLLGNRSEPEATDKLIEIVRTGTDPQLRRSAINALGQKKDPRTTQLLLELIDK